MKLRKIIEYTNKELDGLPSEITKIISNLESLGYKKYQLDIQKYVGRYFIGLPTSGLSVKALQKIIPNIPSNSTIGVFSNLGSSLYIDTNIKVK